MRDYYLANKEVMRGKEKIRTKIRRLDQEFVESEKKRGREYWRKLRHEVIMAYGGYKCNCCGETEPLFLVIDHVNNDGAEHRRSISNRKDCGNGKGASADTWRWLKNNDYPDGFQVLCMNCNFGKSRNKGICPHKTIS